MKKLSLLLIVLVLMVSCSDDVVFVDVQESAQVETIVPTRLRTPDEAVTIAENALWMISDATPTSRSGQQRRVSTSMPVLALTTKSPNAARTKASSRSTTGAADTLMYVVNYADNMGFALVSAPRTAPELLAVTVAGSFDPANSGDNPGFNLYMDCATQYLEEKLQEDASNNMSVITPGGTIPPGGFPITPMPTEYISQDTIWHKHVRNQVKVFWGQHDPEGKECPNGASGCSITAMAMAMSAFKYPENILLSYPNADIGEITLDWNKLNQHKSFDYWFKVKKGEFVIDPCMSLSNDYPVHLRLAQLCRELGHRCETNYDMVSGESGTIYPNVMNTLRQLGFNVTYKECGHKTICDDLSVGTILLMRGKNASGEGHMWVCDAVESYHFHYRRYVLPGGVGGTVLPGHEPPKGTLVEEWDDQGGTYNFFNWGWGESTESIPNGMDSPGTADKSGWFADLNFGEFLNDVGYVVVTR